MYIKIFCLGRAISSDVKVEKEIEIQQEAVQLTDGAGQKFEGESQFQLLQTRTRK